MPNLVLDPAAVAELLKGPSGPVYRHLMVVGEITKARTVARLKPGFPREFLGPTIVKRIVSSPAGPVVQVGTDHVTTLPHRISGNPLLVFFWPKAGRTVYFRNVNHPGSDFTAYVTKQLQSVLEELKGLI